MSKRVYFCRKAGCWFRLTGEKGAFGTCQIHGETLVDPAEKLLLENNAATQKHKKELAGIINEYGCLVCEHYQENPGTCPHSELKPRDQLIKDIELVYDKCLLNIEIKLGINDGEIDIENNKTYKKVELPQVLARVQDWLYIENLQDLKIILACALDRKISGEPCWLFVVAPPGNTKTEIVRSFVDGEMFYQISTLTTNSLISGYVKSNNKKVEDMASQINDKVLIIKDFTSILSMSKDKRDEILGQLREAYDGYISKKLGNLDKKISIETSFGLIACVTPVIDKHYKPMGQLGERFLKLRLDYDDDHILDGSEKNEGKEEEMRNKISDAIMGFLTNIEVYDVTFSDSDKKKIKLLVKWVAKIRTPVSGRWQGDDFVLDVAPQSEKPTRLYKQFKKLATLLCIIEGKTKFDEQTFRMLERIAMDTAPPDRLKVWQHIVNHNNTPDHEIVKRLRIPRTTLNRIVDSLYRLDLIDKNRDGNEENAPYFCSISENAIKSFGALESGQIMGQLSVPETSQSQRKL